jgi:hypothetical protein
MERVRELLKTRPPWSSRSLRRTPRLRPCRGARHTMARPAAMEDVLCDSDLDTTAAQALSRRSGTSGPVRRPYEA